MRAILAGFRISVASSAPNEQQSEADREDDLGAKPVVEKVDDEDEKPKDHDDDDDREKWFDVREPMERIY